MSEITPEERRAINAMKRLSKKWPANLWVFAAGGQLHIMRGDGEGGKVHVPGGGIDSDYMLESIDICSDGGDW